MKCGYINRLHEEPLQYGWRHMAGVLWREIFTLIKANLCFLLFSAPIITIPAAATAIHSICVDAIRGKPVKVFRTYWTSVTALYLPSAGAFCCLLLGIFSGIYGTLFYYWWPFSISFMGIILVLPASIGVISFLMVPYCFNMIACTKLSMFKILKNSFLLVFLNLRFSICGGVLTAALILLQFQFWIFLLPVILTCGIALTAYVASYFAFYGIDKFVVIKNEI